MSKKENNNVNLRKKIFDEITQSDVKNIKSTN